MEFNEKEILLRLLRESEENSREIARILHIVRKIERDQPTTPTGIQFKELTMLPTTGGNILIYTGTTTPPNAQFPAGTTFTVTSNDAAVNPTVDATGLIVTIPLPTNWIENPTTPLAISYATSTFTPEPSGSPSSLTAVITPSVATPTPSGIQFNQTT